MTNISRSLPPALQNAMGQVKTSLGLKVRQTESYARQKQLAYGLTSGTLPCQRIGNYDAVKLVEGQLSIIYLGRDFVSGDFFALKGPSEFFGNERIKHEVAMLERLQFAGVVKSFGSIVATEQSSEAPPLYLIEEYIFGVPASELKLDYPEIVHVMLNAVTTLDKIHKAGLTHQNHWQGNMIVSDSGSLTFVDFNCCQTRSDFRKLKRFEAKTRIDLFWLAKRMRQMFGPMEQTYPIAQLLNTIGREAAEGERSPCPYKTCDEFLDAIYETLRKPVG